MFGFEKPKKKRNEEDERRPLTGMEMRRANLPGTDTYDDGLDEQNRLREPGSTSTESGGRYMEDKGPNDMRHRAADVAHEYGIVDPEVTITDSPEQSFDDEDDDAARWLRENDPTLRT